MRGGKADEVAQLLADGKLTYEEIAAKIGVSRSTLYRWLRTPEFAAKVDEGVDDYRKVIRRRGLAILERRVEALNDRWLRMQRVIDERAADPEMADVPGGTTGLLAKRPKRVEVIGGGEDGPRSTTVYEYEVDTGLLKELREHEKQAAQELGQWVEKGSQEVTGPSGGALQFAAMVDKVYGAADKI